MTPRPIDVVIRDAHDVDAFFSRRTTEVVNALLERALPLYPSLGPLKPNVTVEISMSAPLSCGHLSHIELFSTEVTTDGEASDRFGRGMLEQFEARVRGQSPCAVCGKLSTLLGASQ